MVEGGHLVCNSDLGVEGLKAAALKHVHNKGIYGFRKVQSVDLVQGTSDFCFRVEGAEIVSNLLFIGVGNVLGFVHRVLFVEVDAEVAKDFGYVFAPFGVDLQSTFEESLRIWVDTGMNAQVLEGSAETSSVVADSKEGT